MLLIGWLDWLVRCLFVWWVTGRNDWFDGRAGCLAARLAALLGRFWLVGWLVLGWLAGGTWLLNCLVWLVRSLVVWWVGCLF